MYLRALGQNEYQLGRDSVVTFQQAPIALGTETIGSLITPAVRAAVYTIKPTYGIVNSVSIVPITARYDTVGPIGRTSKDVADLLDILVDHDKTSIPDGGYAAAMVYSWSDIKVGTLDPEKWRPNDAFVKPVPEATKQIVCA